jgi:CheY-like chemotaxis protein
MQPTLPLLRGRRVLAVDDHDTNRRVIKSQLEQYDVDIVCAASADDAWRELTVAREAGRPFEVALIDRHLPGCDGLEFGRRIRRHPALNATRLILLTTSGHGDEPLFAGCGFAACLVKPVSQRDLTEGLNTTLFGGAVAAQVPEPQYTPPAGAGHWILLAEDNVVNEKVACRTLEKLGYRVEVARNGRDAVDAWATGRFELVLMDCQMPVLDGYEAAREIRRREDGVRRTPIVALTAHAMRDDDLKCKAAGMDDYITKPLDREHLRRCLRRFLQDAEAPADSPAQRDGTRSA